MLYVNMRDKFMSGWGGASGGTSYYCVACTATPSFPRHQVANAIVQAAQQRGEMKNIATSSAPRRKRSASDHVKTVQAFELSGPWCKFMPDKMVNELQAMRTAAEAAEALDDAERIRIYKTYNWNMTVPPVCTAAWDDLAWAKHIGDKELIRAREAGILQQSQEA